MPKVRNKNRGELFENEKRNKVSKDANTVNKKVSRSFYLSLRYIITYKSTFKFYVRDITRVFGYY